MEGEFGARAEDSRTVGRGERRNGHDPPPPTSCLAARWCQAMLRGPSYAPPDTHCLGFVLPSASQSLYFLPKLAETLSSGCAFMRPLNFDGRSPGPWRCTFSQGLAVFQPQPHMSVCVVCTCTKHAPSLCLPEVTCMYMCVCARCVHTLSLPSLCLPRITGVWVWVCVRAWPLEAPPGPGQEVDGSFDNTQPLSQGQDTNLGSWWKGREKPGAVVLGSWK